MKKMKGPWRVCLVSLGAYAVFFLAGALVYPKLKIDNYSAQAKVSMEEPQLAIQHTNEEASIYGEREGALALRLNLIDQAQHSLCLTQYAIEDEDSGDLFIQHLLRAAQRGVKVRFIYNGLANKWKGKDAYKKEALLSCLNIEVKTYGGLHFLRPWEVNNVLHDKLMIVDQKYLLSSGRNIGDRFLLKEATNKQTYDMDIIVKAKGKEAPLLAKAQQYFEEIWTARFAHQQQTTKKGAERRRCVQKMLKTEKYLRRQYPTTQQNIVDHLSFVPIEAADFWHNDPNENIKQPVIWQKIAALINRNQSLTLQTPYLVLTPNMQKYLQVPSKVQAQLLTNSTASSPNFFAYSYYVAHRKTAQKYFHLFEYQGPGSIHNKEFLYDKDIVGVGSYNTDSRSSFLDCENLIVIQSSALYQQLFTLMKAYEKISTGPSPSSVALRPLPLWKEVLMHLSGYLFTPFAYLT